MDTRKPLSTRWSLYNLLVNVGAMKDVGWKRRNAFCGLDLSFVNDTHEHVTCFITPVPWFECHMTFVHGRSVVPVGRARHNHCPGSFLCFGTNLKQAGQALAIPMFIKATGDKCKLASDPNHEKGHTSLPFKVLCRDSESKLATGPLTSWHNSKQFIQHQRTPIKLSSLQEEYHLL